MREVVVLLVGPTSLPGRLEEALLAKGMFVESCEIEQASGTLLVSSPNVVITSHDALHEVARSLRAANDSSEVRLLVMAPRGQVSKLRRELSEQVTAVLPFDLPPAAVAVRVKTVIKKETSEALEPAGDLAFELKAPNAHGADPRVEPAKLKPSPLTFNAPQTVTIPLSTRAVTTTTRRVSLQVPATSLTPLRIAVLDEDVTRADAISTSLRKSGHDVFLVSGLSGRARWHLLRKFAPQAIVVDEAGLSQDGGAWISAFRSDAFLQSTPLVAVALESFFDTEAGIADVSGLTPQLEGLGRAEGRFLTELTVGREIEVSGSQVSLARLLALIAEAGTPTTIEIKSRSESLLWRIASGRADQASLTSRGRSADIPPADALDWSLSCSTSEILVRPQERLHVQDGVLVEELLHAAYRENLPLEAAFSAPGFRTKLAPHSGGRPPQGFSSPDHNFDSGAQDSLALDSLAPDSELPTRPVALSQIPGVAQMKKAGAATSTEPVTAPRPTPSAPQFHSNLGSFSEEAEQESTPSAVVKDSMPPSSLHRNTPPGFVRAIVAPSSIGETLSKKARWAGAAAVLVLMGGAVTRFASDDDSPARLARDDPKGGVLSAPAGEGAKGEQAESLPGPEKATKREPQADIAPANGPPPDSTGSSAGDEEIWKVKNVAKIDDCDVLLERPLDYYTSRPKWEGEKIWKRARHRLLMGEHEAANRLMCQAAFIDSDGRASVGLGEYYLSRRALETAKEWAQYGIEQRPDGARKSRELLGDILSQMGQNAEAKEQWLQTMKLEPDDLPKLRSVAKTLARLGRTARTGGDASLAERLFRRAATLDEDNLEASAGLASALLKNGEPDLARKWARRTLSLDASSGDALLVLGDLAREQGDIEAARREYQDIKSGTAAFKVAQERLDAL